MNPLNLALVLFGAVLALAIQHVEIACHNRPSKSARRQDFLAMRLEQIRSLRVTPHLSVVAGQEPLALPAGGGESLPDLLAANHRTLTSRLPSTAERFDKLRALPRPRHRSQPAELTR